MNEIILKVDYKNNQLITNFESVKEQVRAEVEKYTISVTEENIPEAKKAMANFNKVKSEIGNKYKEWLDYFSIPVNQLKTEKKELETIINDGRQEIANGVAEFEAKKLEIIKETIQTYINEQCQAKDINADLISANEFLKLTAVTQNGNLAKATKDAIDNKIALIENEILKEKIKAEEKAKRDREIAEEARREAEEKARKEKEELKEKAEKEKAEAKAKAEREKAEALAKAEQDKQRALAEAEERNKKEEERKINEALEKAKLKAKIEEKKEKESIKNSTFIKVNLEAEIPIPNNIMLFEADEFIKQELEQKLSAKISKIEII